MFRHVKPFPSLIQHHCKFDFHVVSYSLFIRYIIFLLHNSNYFLTIFTSHFSLSFFLCFYIVSLFSVLPSLSHFSSFSFLCFLHFLTFTHLYFFRFLFLPPYFTFNFLTFFCVQFTFSFCVYFVFNFCRVYHTTETFVPAQNNIFLWKISNLCAISLV